MAVNKENIQKWIDALRSGEYGQTTGVLKSDDQCYCCLGVACEISGLGRWEHEEHANPNFVEDSSRSDSALTVSVVDWLGLSEVDPYLLTETGEQYRASKLNDSFGKSFEEIANCIERTYLDG